MKVLQLLCVFAFWVADGILSSACSQPPDRAETNFIPVRIHHSFSGTLKLRTSGGPQAVPVSALVVAIENHQAVNGPKELTSGLSVMEFQAGDIQIKVGPQTERATGSEFLILPSDSKPLFSTGNDTGSFVAVVFGEPVTKVRAGSLEIRLVKTQLEKFEQVEGGVLRRRRFVAAAVGEFSIEVQDLEVGPVRKTDFIKFPGAALIQVTSGKGTMEQDKKNVSVEGGSFLSIEEGTQVKFRNLRSDIGLSMRVTVLRAR